MPQVRRRAARLSLGLAAAVALGGCGTSLASAAPPPPPPPIPNPVPLLETGRAWFNVVNFVRREHGMDTVRAEWEAIRARNLPATWLLQYDALLDPEMAAFFKALPPSQERGLWLEVVRPQCADAGVAYQAPGERSWNPAGRYVFLAGYAPADREKLIDVAMAKFKEVFGDRPKSVAAWYLDAHSLGILDKKYGVAVAGICRDQWTLNEYTFWGGYYHFMYYPSRVNALLPAQREARRCRVPVIRLLGNDPVNAYTDGKKVMTLEPWVKEFGGNPAWVRRFYDIVLDPKGNPFGHAVTGQENDFKWAPMREAYAFQLDEAIRRRDAGALTIAPLGETGRWFRDTFPANPAYALAGADPLGGRRHAAWYFSPFYRVRFAWDDASFVIQDLVAYDDGVPEAHLEEPCRTDLIQAVAPFFMDGAAWGGGPQAMSGLVLEGDAGADGRSFSERSVGIADVTVERRPGELAIAWRNARGASSRIRCLPQELQVMRRYVGPGRVRLAETWQTAEGKAPGLRATVTATDGAKRDLIPDTIEEAVSVSGARVVAWRTAIPSGASLTITPARVLGGTVVVRGVPRASARGRVELIAVEPGGQGSTEVQIETTWRPGVEK